MSDELLALLMSAAGGNDQHVAALAAARIRELEAERDALLERREVLGDQLDKINDDLTSTIIERDALRGLLREAREDWIKVGYGASHEDVAACRDFCARIDLELSK